MTLEELRTFLKKEIKPDVFELLKPRVTDEASLKGCDKKLKEAILESIDLRNKLYKVYQGAIETVEYNTNNEPTVIQTLDFDLKPLYRICGEIDTARKARFEHEYEKGLGVQDGISRQVSKKTLEQYGVTDEKLSLLGNGSVYEITLDSILSSRWFNKEMQDKGKNFFDDWNFLQAVNKYTDNVTILKKIPVVVKGQLYHLKYEKEEDRVEETWDYYNSSINIVYKLSGAPFEKMQDQLNEQLKAVRKDYKKRAAVILFLLFDEMTPPEYRVQWVQNQSTFYEPSTNRISLENVMKGIEEYLQTRLGLNKSFENYQKEFETVFPNATENNKTTENNKNTSSDDSNSDYSSDNEDDESDSSDEEGVYPVDPRFCFVLRKPQELVTLEQLNEFITKHLEENIKKNIEESEKFETYEKKHGYIKTVTYDTDEFGNTVPTVIEYKPGDHMNFLRDHLDDLETNPLRRNQDTDVLKELSREVTTEELKKYEITDEELKLLGGQDSICKITFNSILKSNLFNKEQKKRALRIYYCELGDEIKAYVDKAAFVNSIPVILRNVTDNTKKTISFTYKVSGKALEKTREYLREALRGMIGGWNRLDAKVTLLLLLDEMTPPEYRVLWRFTGTEGSHYRTYYNMICVNKNNLEDISHEIGHYLQKHLGLPEKFEGFKNTFAKKLLLLESEWEESNKTVSLPKPLSDIFEYNYWGVPKVFTEKDLFMRWQLFSRWERPSEISNILGLYFDQDGKTVYVNMLSDADALTFQYGHTSKDLEYDNYKKKDENEFKNPEEQSVFEEIVKKAAELKPDLTLWNIVNKLHEYYWRDDTIKNTFDKK